MATYKSEEVNILSPASSVYEKLSNLNGLGDLLKNVNPEDVPADKMKALEGIRTTEDSISFPGGPVGDVTLRVARTVPPTLIRMEGEGTPVPLSLELRITPLTAETCSAIVEIEIKIPAMLKPMVNGPLQKMTDEFAQMLRSIRF